MLEFFFSYVRDKANILYIIALQAKELIDVQRVEASLLLVALKKLNRLEKVRTRAGRDALHKEKQRVDSTHLLLQNLLYEADHLDKEVTKCLQFKSKDEEIELVPLSEFYKNAPAEISRPVSIQIKDHCKIVIIIKSSIIAFYYIFYIG